jgi:phospholipase C
MRRRLLPLVLLLAAAAVPAQAASPEKTTTKTPIKHFVVLMQENHSYDNYFGTYKKGDGIPADACQARSLKNPKEGCIKPFRIANRVVEDLNHSSRVALRQLNHGKMNGFVDALRREGGQVQPNTMGHYDDKDIPYYWNIADNFVLFDRFFTSSLGGSVSNHMYWVTGTPGNNRVADEVIPPGGFNQATIFDRLEEKGISWKFYVQNYDAGINFRNRGVGDRGSQIVWVPLLNYARYLDNPKLSSHIVDLSEYYKDLNNGTLPAVSYIAPAGSSEHPPGSIQAGERFVRTLINGLMRSSAWDSSAFMWTYDDWGGWYDHVKPPQVDKWGLGFRAPALLVSPYAKRGHIEHATLDFTSMLKFIENNWGVAPLAERDRNAADITGAFDFTKPPREPHFVQATRPGPKEKEPRRTVIYIAYGFAVAIAAITVLGAIRRERRPKDPVGKSRKRRPKDPDDKSKKRDKVGV